MKNLRVIFFSIAAVSLLFDRISFASTSSNTNELPCRFYTGFRHIEAKGVGYEKGYSTIESLVFPVKSGGIYEFVDLRFHYDNKIAANAGAGVRFIPCNNNYAYGLNAYYDYRRGCHNDFHQLGIGAEFLSRCFDIRANGYFPVKDSATCSTCACTNYTNDYFIKRKKLEVAFRGGDLEVGELLLNRRCINLYAAIGPYFYQKCKGCKNNNIFGGRGRVVLAITRYLSLQGIITHDELFHTRVQGEIALHIPLGCGCCKEIRNFLAQPVVRHEMIVLDEECRWKWNYNDR